MAKGKLRVILTAVLIFIFSAGGCTDKPAVPEAEDECIEEAEETAAEDTEIFEETVSDNTETIAEPPAEEPDPLPATVFIHGSEYDRNETHLDLSDCAPEEIPEIADIIRDMPCLQEIVLMDDEGTSRLSLDDVALLTDAAPDAEFVYSFDLYDKRISLSDNEIKIKNADIGNEGEESIRQVLAALNKCSRFVLDECGIDDEVMDAIDKDFPDIRVVWRVHVGNKTALTDDPIIRMTHGINDSMTGPLKYCTDVVYMDLGHDEGISDISFVANMPKLECLILSAAGVTDLSPLKNCRALTWLELVNCVKLKDISPVAGIDSIKYLNISDSGVRDISPVMDMKLERFSCIGNGISKETIEEFVEAQPDCMYAFTGSPWGYAWRYDDYGYHFFSYYARMREVFRYEERSPGGYVFPEDEEPEEEEAEEDTEETEENEDAEGAAEEDPGTGTPAGEPAPAEEPAPPADDTAADPAGENP